VEDKEKRSGRKNRRGAPSEVAERFGVNLRRLRIKANLSQERLALLAGLHRTEVSLLERGRREPRIGTVVRLAGPLEVSSNDLLDGLAWLGRPDKPRDGAFYVGDQRVG
jgi:transcriptional regulator with XRE-family HTH domain